MGRKDEIDKLMQAERKKLAMKDEKSAEFEKRQVQQLQELLPLLEEVAESIDKNYLSVSFNVRRGPIFVDVGRIDKERLDIQWQIESNSRPSYWGLKHATGFVISELNSEERVTFLTGEEVVQYMLPKIIEKVAYYENLKDRSEDQ